MTPLGKLGILCLCGTGGKPEQRHINPLALNAYGEVDWKLYGDRTRQKATAFGVTRRMIWCPEGTTGSEHIWADGWSYLYKQLIDAIRAGHAFAAAFGKDDAVFLGSHGVPRGSMSAWLSPYVNCGEVMFDESSRLTDSDYLFLWAGWLADAGIRITCESVAHRQSPWYSSPDYGQVMEWKIYEKYHRPVKDWGNATDQSTLVPFWGAESEFQGQTSVYVSGEHDNAGTEPSLDDVAQMLALGRNVYVAPDKAGRWRGVTGPMIVSVARAMQRRMGAGKA